MKEKLINLYNDKKNLIVCGNISSGKTTNILFPIVEKIIKNKESIFILDSKEEYLNKYYETLKNNNYNVIIINLRNPLKSEGWNPFLYPYELYKNGQKDEALNILDNIGESIFYEKSSTDPFWSKTASDIFAASVLGLFQDAKKEEINLNSVAAILENFATRLGNSTYSADYFNLKDVNSDAYKYARATVSAPPETKGGILSVAKQKIRLYVSRENLNLMLSETTFNLEESLTKPTAIFFIIHDELTAYSRIATMFIEQLYSILLNDNKNRFNFILDNFDSLESFNYLKNMLSSCTSRNIKVYLATRSLDKLEKDHTTYIEKLANGILINKDSIDIIIDNDKEKLEKDFKEIIIPTSNIDYPNLETKSVKTFSVIDFVNDQKRTKITKTLTNEEGIKIENLLKKIDEKIAELESKGA